MGKEYEEMLDNYFELHDEISFDYAEFSKVGTYDEIIKYVEKLIMDGKLDFDELSDTQTVIEDNYDEVLETFIEKHTEELYTLKEDIDWTTET